MMSGVSTFIDEYERETEYQIKKNNKTNAQTQISSSNETSTTEQTTWRLTLKKTTN